MLISPAEPAEAARKKPAAELQLAHCASAGGRRSTLLVPSHPRRTFPPRTARPRRWAHRQARVRRRSLRKKLSAHRSPSCCCPRRHTTPRRRRRPSAGTERTTRQITSRPQSVQDPDVVIATLQVSTQLATSPAAAVPCPPPPSSSAASQDSASCRSERLQPVAERLDWLHPSTLPRRIEHWPRRFRRAGRPQTHGMVKAGRVVTVEVPAAQIGIGNTVHEGQPFSVWPLAPSLPPSHRAPDMPRRSIVPSHAPGLVHRSRRRP